MNRLNHLTRLLSAVRWTLKTRDSRRDHLDPPLSLCPCVVDNKTQDRPRTHNKRKATNGTNSSRGTGREKSTEGQAIWMAPATEVTAPPFEGRRGESRPTMARTPVKRAWGGADSEPVASGGKS